MPNRRTITRAVPRTLLLAALAAGMVASLLLAAPSVNSAASETHAQARFRVDAQVVNPVVTAFATSTAARGNSYSDVAGGFEPVIVRDAFLATADARNEIHAPSTELSHWDVFSDAMLEGAEVDVWRIQGGHMQRVRSDRVAAKGAHVSDWQPVIPGDRVLPAGTHRATLRWDDYSAPDSTYAFSVRAVDQQGHENPAAPWAMATSPHDLRKVPPVADVSITAPRSSTALFPHTAPAAKALRARVGSDGLLELEWDAAPDTSVAGWRVYRSDQDPARLQGSYLALAGDAQNPAQQIHKGDWVMWRRKLYRITPELFSKRVWGTGEGWRHYLPAMLDFPSDTPGRNWELAPHTADSPLPDGGETFLKLQLARGEHVLLQVYNHSGRDQHWYDVLQPQPYQFSVWMRQEGSGRARFRVLGDYEQPGQRIAEQVLDVGARWKMQFGQFTPPTVLRGNRADAMALDLEGPATFYIDDFRVKRADAHFLAWLPEDTAALRESGMAAVRTHALIKSQLGGYDLEQLTNTGGTVAGIPGRNSLPQILAALKAAGTDPWMQIEPYFRPEEWLGLLEYLAAPYDPKLDTPVRKPWAWKRYRQGHPTPWTNDFRTLRLEIGNETWNGIFRPWAFPAMTDQSTGHALSAGTVYGTYQESVIRLLKSSPWWGSAGLEGKMRFVIGGWAAVQNYGFDAAQASPSSDELTIAAYNGGWDSGAGPMPDNAVGFFTVLNDVSQTAIPVAENLQRAAMRLNAARAHTLALGTYEAGPGYNLNGLNGAHVTPEEDEAEDRVMKSLAAGTATLDAFMARAYLGFSVQNFFAFSRGGKWGSHARWLDGGQAWPSWQLLSLFNREGTGEMLHTSTLQVPTVALPPSNSRKSEAAGAQIGVYALRRGQRFMLFVLSRRSAGYPDPGSDGYTQVSIELPFHHHGRVTLFAPTGKATDNNLQEERVRITTTTLGEVLEQGSLTLGARSGLDPRGIAPGTTLLYVFEDTDLPRSTTVTGELSSRPATLPGNSLQ